MIHKIYVYLAILRSVIKMVKEMHLWDVLMVIVLQGKGVLQYISKKNQNYIAVAIDSQQSSPSQAQAKRMRELDEKKLLNGDVIDGIMMEDKKEVIVLRFQPHTVHCVNQFGFSGMGCGSKKLS